MRAAAPAGLNALAQCIGIGTSKSLVGIMMWAVSIAAGVELVCIHVLLHSFFVHGLPVLARQVFFNIFQSKIEASSLAGVLATALLALAPRDRIFDDESIPWRDPVPLVVFGVVYRSTMEIVTNGVAADCVFVDGVFVNPVVQVKIVKARIVKVGGILGLGRMLTACAVVVLQILFVLNEGANLVLGINLAIRYSGGRHGSAFGCNSAVGHGFVLQHSSDLSNVIRYPCAITRDTWDGAGRVAAAVADIFQQRVYTLPIVRLREVIS